MEKRLATDVLVIGGGLAGGSLAAALAVGGLDVVVVDHADAASLLDRGFDGRASAIARASERLLEGVGIWAHLGDRLGPIRDIRVTDGASPLFLHYDHRDTGQRHFGTMVENRHMRMAQQARMAELDGLRLLAPAALDRFTRDAAGVSARLGDGRTVTARLIVGADGRASQVRGQAGIRISRWDYAQTGIVCTVEHQHPHNGIAQERFLPAGPFAILPLPGNRSSLVWTEKSHLAGTIMALDEVGFLAELSERFGDYLGGLRLSGPRWAYPLSLQAAETNIGNRLALVADAAQAMHPIAGQGLNMGLRDVAALAEVLVDAQRLGLDIGGGDVLQRYARWRRFDNTLMLAMTDGLNRLFSNHNRPLRLVRDIGLAVFNTMPPLKRLAMQHAMGLAGDLPRLMRGEAL